MKIEAKLTPELVQAINNLTTEDYAKSYISDLDKIKNFFINNWNSMLNNSVDDNIKRFLINVCAMQEMFQNFVQEGGME